MNPLGNAFGEGWLGTLIVGVVMAVLAGVGGWFARRPLEKAGILEAVNKRMNAFMDHLQGELERVTSQHKRCEERLDDLEEGRRRDREEIDQLRGQLNQEKQVGASIARLGSAE